MSELPYDPHLAVRRERISTGFINSERSDSFMSKGVFYIAAGDQYIENAIKSAETVKRDGNDIKIGIIVDNKHKSSAKLNSFDKVVSRDMIGSLRDKVQKLSPLYDKNIFLDTDTIALGDISPLFKLLDRVEIACARSPTTIVEIDEVPDCFPELNTGVICFNKNTKVKEFFDEYRYIYENQLQNGYPNQYYPVDPEADTMEEATSYGRLNDQPAFRKALYLTDISYSILPREYNFRGWGPSVHTKVKVVHARGLIQNDKFINNINDTPGGRCYLNGTLYQRNSGAIRIKPEQRSIFHTVANPFIKNLPLGDILRRIGLYETSKKMFECLK